MIWCLVGLNNGSRLGTNLVVSYQEHLKIALVWITTENMPLNVNMDNYIQYIVWNVLKIYPFAF